ncbi:Uncharacterised protein [Raoultella terrigena]|nr:Uncharacterised protein [Raoultella terrigena]
MIITLPRIGLTLASGTQIRQSVTDASPDSGSTKKPLHNTSIAVVKDNSHKEIELASTIMDEYSLKNEPAWSGDGNKPLASHSCQH